MVARPRKTARRPIRGLDGVVGRSVCPLTLDQRARYLLLGRFGCIDRWGIKDGVRVDISPLVCPVLEEVDVAAMSDPQSVGINKN